MESLAGFAWDQVTWATVVISIIYAILRGYLVPRATLDRLVEEQARVALLLEEAHRAQLDDLKTSVALREQSNQALLGQQQRLLEIAYLAKDAGVRLETGNHVTP